MKQITISDITVDLIRKNIKNINLAIYPESGRIRVSAPLLADEKSIKLFITSKINWINRHRDKFRGLKKSSLTEVKTGDTIMLWGISHKLELLEKPGAPIISVRDGKVEMLIKPGSSVEQKKKVLNRWYRRELFREINSIVPGWEKLMKIKVNEIRVRQMKTRWGTCNTVKRRILLNLELVKKPVHCLEYVIVHEMIHFFEKYHNDYFKNLLGKYLPDWKTLKAELKKIPVNMEMDNIIEK